MPSLAMLAGAGVLWLLSVVGVWFYAHDDGWHEGYDKRTAEEVGQATQALVDYQAQTQNILREAASRAFADERARLDNIATVSTALAQSQEKADDALYQARMLARPMQCFMPPELRVRIDAFRRPPGLGLAGGPEAAVHAAVPREGPRAAVDGRTGPPAGARGRAAGVEGGRSGPEQAGPATQR